MARSLRFDLRSLTTWSLASLAAGLTLGVIGHASESRAVASLASAVQPLGAMWLAALQATVLPLVLSNLLAAIAGARVDDSVGRLSGRAITLFAAMVGGAGLFTYAVTPVVLGLYQVDAAAMTAVAAAAQVPEAAIAAEAIATGSPSAGQWLSGFVPRNLVQATLSGDFLPLLLFTALFGTAVRQLPAEPRDLLTRVFQALAAVMMTVAIWIMRFAPIGVFTLILSLAIATGLDAAGVLGAFVVGQSAMLLIACLALYPLSVVIGRASWRAFTRALIPAQLVAVSTRSSVAALPALIQGGRDHLRLPESSTGFILPLGTSVFKINRTISSSFKLLFLAHVHGIPLNTETLAVFLVSMMILSFSTVGVPSGGSAFRGLPAYMAAGVPIASYIVLEAVDAIPDIFKTLINVTGQMSAATLLSRSSRAAGAVPVAGDDIAGDLLGTPTVPDNA